MQKVLFRLSVTSLVLILLVMLAGSIVRMTGSGMGCPDWPKCFGYMIPPTDAETLTWQSQRSFQKGNIIIREEALQVAKRDFTSSEIYDPANWEPYTKHDYAVFNPMHTWVEFINRLIGVLAGLPVLALFVVSIFYFKKQPLVTFMAFFGVLLLGFEAWLGKRVVDGNLIPHSITYHLFGAIALVMIYVFLISKLEPPRFAFLPRSDKRIKWLGYACMGLLLIQIWLGTSLREEVDVIATAGSPRRIWIDALSWLFEVHRTFSLVVLAVVAWFAISVIRTRSISTWPRVLLGLIGMEILAGMGLAYLGVPAILQPVHLMFAVLSLATLWYIVLAYGKRTVPAVAG
jgi:cytochrome c oxidase assembly protein subunit 15